MMRFILCEGKTDLVLLSYYLEKCAGWSYNSEPKRFKLKFSQEENKEVCAYKKGKKEELIICAVGGRNNFKSFFERYIKNFIILAPEEEEDIRIALVTDRDNLSVEELENNIKEQLSPIIEDVKDNVWINNFVKNEFSKISKVCFLLVTIPEGETGALETMLMRALSENEYNAVIVEKSKDFVSQISSKAQKYIPTDRLKLKAQLGVALSVMNPEKIFALFDEQLKSIAWEKSKTLKRIFEKLLQI